MARRSDPRPKRRRGVLRHYRRPIWRDRLFWLIAVSSILATAVFVAVIMVVTGVPETALGWLRPVLLGLVALLLSFRLLGAGVTTSRNFQRGLGEGSAPRPNDLEAKGRAAGAVVGRAMKATRSLTPAPTTNAAPAAVVEPTAVEPAKPIESEPIVEAETEPVAAEPEPVEPEPTTDEAVAPSITTEPEPEPTPAPTPSAAPKVTADAAARSVGSMVGRRLAERRKKT